MYPIRNTRPVSATEIARAVSGSVVCGGECTASWVCPLDIPHADHLTFAKDVTPLLNDPSRFTGVIVLVPIGTAPVSGACLIEVNEPRTAFAVAFTDLFQMAAAPSIHPTAVIDPTAVIAADASIGPNAIISRGVHIGSRSIIRGNVVLAPDVKIGENCVIKSNAVIGEEGFGYVKDVDAINLRIPHFGSVVIGDNVEVGAGTIICGGTIEPTRIGNHVKIDDQVFIAHNCQIAENALIIACAEISGSVKIGRNVWVGPNATIINGIEVCDDAFLGIGACVTKPIVEPGVYAGNPARLLRRL
jgi:UDP-3-O-[3-hydroxymyristoyl] glucosamine N-acyltransferase